MKKTLFGVLAFVLVLATVLTGSVFAVASDANTHVGVAPLVPADNPIKVDGKMDLAYTQCPAIPIDFYAVTGNQVYTVAYAYFAWSQDRNALYAYVLVNDYEIGLEGASPWQSDSVEMFIDWTNSGKQEWGVDGVAQELKRGLQYRLSSKGLATCYLLEEDNGRNALDATYYWDSDAGRFVNNQDNKLINAALNIFGWTTNEDDSTGVEKGWASSITEYGYAVEFQLKYTQGTLAAGQEIGFDFQMNDIYTDIATNTHAQGNVYYSGTYRVTAGAWDAGNNCLYYDYITLGSEAVANDRIISNDDLGEYGMAEATSRETTTKATERTTTKKVTINRIHTYKDGANTTTKPAGGNTPGGNGGNGNGGNNAGDNGGNGGASSGGCGSSIAIGSSIAMVAMIGAAGFLTFRRKKDND